VEHGAIELLLLLLVGSAVGMVARRLRVPYSLALVVAGIALSFVDLHQLEAFQLSADVLFTFLLPALLFEAALHLDLHDLKRDAKIVALFALPGVLISTGLAAAILYGGLAGTGLASIGWREALLFGAMISATDPVSVLSLFRELGVPRRLYVLVEGESLLNDGVAVVLFAIVGAAYGLNIGHGHHEALLGSAEIAVFAVRTFVWMAIGGALIGAIVGGLASAVLATVDDHLIEITLTTTVAYGSFLLAEHFGASGVLSTVTAGLVTGFFGARYGMSTRTRLAVEDFWEYAAFAANTVVFLLVGLELHITDLLADALPIAVAFAAMILSRAAFVYLSTPLLPRLGDPMPRSWSHVLVWGGLRGGLSMVLVLGLPADLPTRPLLIHLVFGAVSGSLFLQGITVGPLLAKLGLSRVGHAEQLAADIERARLLGLTHALRHAEHLKHEGVLDGPAHDRLHAWYAAQREHAETELYHRVGSQAELTSAQLVEGLIRLAEVEREAVRHAARTDAVSAEAAVAVLAQLDERLSSLREANAGHTPRFAVLEHVLGSNPDEQAVEDASR